jgi:hypothetical protein
MFFNGSRPLSVHSMGLTPLAYLFVYWSNLADGNTWQFVAKNLSFFLLEVMWSRQQKALERIVERIFYPDSGDLSIIAYYAASAFIW